jgi:hypothetical protein
LVASSLLAGCPIYPVDSCYSSYDCPSGYTCDSYLGQCVAEPTSPGDDDDDDRPPSGTAGGAPTPPPRDRTCVAPGDCLDGETCGEKGYCLPGDCTFWGCVEGYECAETLAKTFSCEKPSEPPPPPAPVCGSSTVAPPASGSLSFADGDLKLSFCLAGLESDPATSSLRVAGELAATGEPGAAISRQATLTIVGRSSSTATIDCNGTTPASATCQLSVFDANDEQRVDYEALSRPFTIEVTTWTDTAFAGSAEGIPLLRTATPADPNQQAVKSEVVTDLIIEAQAEVIQDDPGTRPPPIPAPPAP